MDQVLERQSAPETIPEIEATLNYLVDNGEKIVTEAGPGGTADMRGGRLDPRRVIIHNGRPHAGEFVLDREGFRFIRHDTKVGEFYNEDEVRRVYYPEMEALVKAESGASRVVVFDHTLRTGDDALRAERKIREVVPRVHNDYTEWSGPQRVRDLLPDEAEALCAGALPSSRCGGRSGIRSKAFRWRSAMRARCRSTIWLISERRYPNRVGQTYAITYNPNNKWFWFPRMRREEAIVFKVYDFRKRRSRPLDRAYRIRRSDFAAPRASAREHRNPHAGVFLRAFGVRPLPLRERAARLFNNKIG